MAPWFYDEVRYDAGQAQVAVEKLQAVRRRVDALGEARAMVESTTVTDWSGRHRDDFDERSRTSQGTLGGISERLATVIARIGAAGEEAAADADRRQRLRREHEAEQVRLEEQRRRECAPGTPTPAR